MHGHFEEIMCSNNSYSHPLPVQKHVRGGGIDYPNDLNGYAGWGLMLLVGISKSVMKGGQTKQHRASQCDAKPRSHMQK